MARRPNTSPEECAASITWRYDGMSKLEPVERDVSALVAAREVHSFFVRNSENDTAGFSVDRFVDRFYTAVYGRLHSPQQGGRSFTMGALVTVLQSKQELGMEYLSVLEPVTIAAVCTGTFVRPEFALLTVGHMITRSHSMGARAQVNRWQELLRHLISHDTWVHQNTIMTHIAGRLSAQLTANKLNPKMAISPMLLDELICRPTKQALTSFEQRNNAELAAQRVVDNTPSRASEDDKVSLDLWTRWRADIVSKAGL